jgi:hypothetical protein
MQQCDRWSNISKAWQISEDLAPGPGMPLEMHLDVVDEDPGLDHEVEFDFGDVGDVDDWGDY